MKKRGEGIHHLAFEVKDIDQQVGEYEKRGFASINPVPKNGADNKRIFFLHPKNTNGVLVELCEERKTE